MPRHCALTNEVQAIGSHDPPSLSHLPNSRKSPIFLHFNSRRHIQSEIPIFAAAHHKKYFDVVAAKLTCKAPSLASNLPTLSLFPFRNSTTITAAQGRNHRLAIPAQWWCDIFQAFRTPRRIRRREKQEFSRSPNSGRKFRRPDVSIRKI